MPASGTMTDFCNTQTGAATVGLSAPVGPGDSITQTTDDNRAFQDPNLPTANPVGGLVSLTVPVGEPDAFSSFVNPLATFQPTGFPTCTADLEAQAVSCSGLVPGENYTATDTRTGSAQGATGDSQGTIDVSFPTGTLQGGDAVTLSNGSRDVTTLHVSHLKVAINGEQSVLAGGSCEAGELLRPAARGGSDQPRGRRSDGGSRAARR